MSKQEGSDKEQSVEQPTPQAFEQAYIQLCEQYGYRIVVQPAFLSRDDGTWSVVLQTSIGQLPKIDNNQSTK